MPNGKNVHRPQPQRAEGRVPAATPVRSVERPVGDYGGMPTQNKIQTDRKEKHNRQEYLTKGEP